MRERRFIGNYTIAGKTLTITDRDIVHQISRVLRLKPSDEVVLSDGKTREAYCFIIEIKKNEVVCGIQKIIPLSPQQHPITLYCALLKKDNFELVVQKATEIGVSRIVPIHTDREVKTGFDRERLEKIIKEAVEQSGRALLPTLGEPIQFNKALQGAKGQIVLFDINAPRLAPQEIKKGSVGVFIGPEGGWSDEELEFAKQSGTLVRSLGDFTLRAETAAIVASYIVLNAMS